MAKISRSQALLLLACLLILSLIVFFLMEYYRLSKSINEARSIENQSISVSRFLEKLKAQNIRLALREKNIFLPAKATWYGGNFHGRQTASGKIFDKTEMTCACNFLPFNSRVKIYYEDKYIIVTVTDRGDMQHQFDLSESAFAKLEDPKKGVIPILWRLEK